MKRSRTQILLLLITLVVAFAFRCYLSLRIYLTNFDTATVGLMGLNILDGDRPLFYYGQGYMGALEPYLASGLFALFGASEFTLSLSPILFSVAWIAGTYLLFAELYGPRGGLAAALCLSVSTWSVAWYSIGAYGGYPAALALGSGSLWLALRLVDPLLSRQRQWTYALPLGFLAGLALWTNYLAGAYLLTGALVLCVFLVRQPDLPRRLVPFLVGGVFFLLGLCPVLLSLAQEGPGHIAEWTFSLKFLRRSLEMLWHSSLPEAFYWPEGQPVALRVMTVLALAGAALTSGVLLPAGLRSARRFHYLLPVFFGFIFLALYLPHHMAHLGVARYILPLSTVLACALFAAPFASPSAWPRWTAGICLALWMATNTASMMVTVRTHAPRKEMKEKLRTEFVHSVLASGVRSVFMVGGHIFGHDGQIYSFTAKNKARFVSVYDERYQPSAQAAEADPAYGFACEDSVLPRLLAALDDLGVSRTLSECPWASLVYDLDFKDHPSRAVPHQEMKARLDGQARGDAMAVLDRVYETDVRGEYDGRSGLTFDLGAARNVNAIWLTAKGWYKLDLPQGYVLEASTDGVTFRVVREQPSRLAVVYTAGPMVYAKGYFGLEEIRFEPVPARYLRLRMTGAQRHSTHWALNECWVFERAEWDAPDWEDSVHNVVQLIQKYHLEFTVADRWLSARLLETQPTTPGRFAVYPRYNSKHAETTLSRAFEPRAGIAVVVGQHLVDEAESVLREVYPEGVTWERHHAGAYTMLRFTNPDPAVPVGGHLIWYQHALLRRHVVDGKVF